MIWVVEEAVLHGAIGGRGQSISEYLDRFFANIEWKDLFRQWNVSCGLASLSDHTITLSTLVAMERRCKNKLFQFKAMWLLDSPKCTRVIRMLGSQHLKGPQQGSNVKHIYMQL